VRRRRGNTSKANEEYGTLWEKTIRKPSEEYLYSGILCHDSLSETANNLMPIKHCHEEKTFHVTGEQGEESALEVLIRRGLLA
jgi:hypothetical protein